MKRYWVPLAGFFWGICLTLAGFISGVQDMSLQFGYYPLRGYLLLALPGFLVGAGWLLVRFVRS